MINHRNSKNKFGAKKVVIDGITFDSQAEGRRYMELKFLFATKKIKDLEIHKKFELRPGYINKKTGKRERPGTYICDFCYYDLERGELVVEDVKSPVTAKDSLYRWKKHEMAYQYGIYIEEVLNV